MRRRSATGTRSAEPACGSAFESLLSRGFAAKRTCRLTRARRRSSLLGADRAHLGNPDLSNANGRLTFAAPMTVQGQGRLRNQLLVGVATSQELSLLKTDKPIRGEDFFPAVVDEADAKGADVALGVGAFRVE